MGTAAATGRGRLFTLSALFLFAFFPILYSSGRAAVHHEMSRHAPLVLAGALYLLYAEHRKAPLAFSTGEGGGPAFLVLGIVLYLLGQVCGIHYASQIAVPLSIFGLADYLLGRNAAGRLRFPIFFLVLAFPIPGKLYYAAVMPLKLMISKSAAHILNLWGYPAVAQGNIITVGAQAAIGVTDACSGLNSLMAALTLAVFYGRVTLTRTLSRWGLVLSVLPIVMGVNVMRVTATALVSVRWGSRWVSGWWHTLEGLVVFTAAVLGLILVEKIISAAEKRRLDG